MSIFTCEFETDATFGVDSRKEVGKKLAGYNCTKVLILADEAMFKFGRVDELKEIISAEGMNVVTYQTELGEPAAAKCDRAYEFTKDQGIDGVVALGGGATIDTAKVVCKLMANGGKSDDYIGYGVAAGNKLFKPLIAMPTTAGTGSEVNWGGMCSDSQDRKSAVRHPATLAVIDPVYTYGLPQTVTANTGIDALSHCAENLFNTAITPNPMADMCAMRGVELAFKWLPIAYKDGSNEEARYWMSFAALLGGYCLKLRRLNFGHSIANQFSDRYHWPHGVGAGLGLAVIVRYGAKYIPEMTIKLAKALNMEVPDNGDLTELGEKVVEAFDNLLKTVGMKNMKELGVEEEFIETMTEQIKGDTKWKVTPAPDFDKMKSAIYESYNY